MSPAQEAPIGEAEVAELRVHMDAWAVLSDERGRVSGIVSRLLRERAELLANFERYASCAPACSLPPGGVCTCGLASVRARLRRAGATVGVQPE